MIVSPSFEGNEIGLPWVIEGTVRKNNMENRSKFFAKLLNIFIFPLNSRPLLMSKQTHSKALKKSAPFYKKM